jgi:hypothetical protein
VSKSKRRISSTQRDKIAIARAKALKAAGILSKQTKLHGGRYISRGVLNKVRQYEATADLGYKAYPVSKEIAKAAKERGFQVVAGTRVIGPKSSTFKKRLAEGQLTGVRPVKGGMMEEVILPHTIYDMRSLVEQLRDTGIDTLKLPGEQFAFKYHGAESYRAFMNSQQLLDYLQHYKSFRDVASAKPEDLQEEFDAFTVFRLHPNDVSKNLRGVTQRKADKKRRMKEAVERGEYLGQPRRGKTYAEKMEALHPLRANNLRKKSAARALAKRQEIMADPVKYAEYKAKAAARSKASRERKKK